MPRHPLHTCGKTEWQFIQHSPTTHENACVNTHICTRVGVSVHLFAFHLPLRGALREHWRITIPTCESKARTRKTSRMQMQFTFGPAASMVRSSRLSLAWVAAVRTSLIRAEKFSLCGTKNFMNLGTYSRLRTLDHRVRIDAGKC